MYTYYSKRLKNKKNIPQSIEKEFDKYVKQIKRFLDHNEKNAKKIEPFSKNNELIEYLLSLSKDLLHFFEWGSEYWYLLVTLAYSKHPEAIKYLEDLTDLCIEKKADLNSTIFRICSFVGNPLLNNIIDKEKKYYEKLYDESDYFKFVKEVGLDISGYNFKKIGGEGRFSFTMTTIPNKEYDFQCETEEDKAKFFSLRIGFSTPQGTERCLGMGLSSPDRSISLLNWDKDYSSSNRRYIEIIDNRTFEKEILSEGENLFNVKEIISKIEKFIGHKFSREKIYFSFERGIRNRKNLEKWLKED